MSLGLVALLLLRLDARMGRWEPVASLAGHFGVPAEVVADHLERLVASGLVRAERSDKSGAIVAAMVEPAGVAVVRAA